MLAYILIGLLIAFGVPALMLVVAIMDEVRADQRRLDDRLNTYGDVARLPEDF